jgi:PAS domain S-box-containing protein
MKEPESKSRGESELSLEKDTVHVSEEWYSAIYEGSPLAMVVWNSERRVVDWNRQAEKVFGWTREEIRGKDFFDFLLPSSALPGVAGVVDLLLAGKLPSRSINENLTKRGETILCEWNNSIQHDSEGKVIGVISLALDITRQKQAEDSLRLFKESVENSSDAVGMSTPEGKHYYQNRAFDELFGQIGENPPETLYVDHAVGHEVFRTIMAGGLWTGEVQMYAKDRSVLDILLRAYANKDLNGRVTVLVGVHTDITERKKAEAGLRESAIKWQTTFNALDSALWLLDKDMRVVLANDATRRVFGSKPQEIIGSYCWEIMHGTQKPIAECPVMRSSQTLRRESMELQVGNQWYDVTAYPVIGDAGALLGFVHVVNNITE